MDRFTKNALIACAILSALIITSFYVGIALGNSFVGADDKVNDAAAQAGGGAPHASLYQLDQNGEYVGFGTIGILGGFATGYVWVMAFEETSNKRGTTDD
ncbi:MAG: hypothetical protein WAL97_02280 [Halobacteriota archaeon]|jgi:hypothetical protein